MPALAPARPAPAPEKTLSERAFRRLREDILCGVLAPGTRLRLNELQARYGMGLSPLRESLLRLSSEGLVRSEGQRGFEVAPISLDELRDLTHARVCLDVAAVAQAMARGDAQWEARVMAANHLLAHTPLPNQTDDVAAASLWEQRHRQFHETLIEGAGSQWLLRLHGQLVDHTERYRRTRLLHRLEAQAQVRDVVAEHAEITEAVIARDIARAERLLTDHLQATANAMVNFFAPSAGVASPA
jgi:DNA-binding GntR family transcriptional regulator